MLHDDDVRAVQKLNEASQLITEQLARVIVGQHQVIEELLVAMFARGHCLLVGVPGLAKTLLISTVSEVLDLSFKRIQFTPDLLPADLVGTEIYRPKTGDFTIKKGPLFNNIILADEINRAPSKVQSALLEAMQERQVSVGRVRHGLADPFFVQGHEVFMTASMGIAFYPEDAPNVIDLIRNADAALYHNGQQVGSGAWKLGPDNLGMLTELATNSIYAILFAMFILLKYLNYR